MTTLIKGRDALLFDDVRHKIIYTILATAFHASRGDRSTIGLEGFPRRQIVWHRGRVMIRRRWLRRWQAIRGIVVVIGGVARRSQLMGRRCVDGSVLEVGTAHTLGVLGILDGNGFGVLVLDMMLLRMYFFVLLEILWALKGLFANLKKSVCSVRDGHMIYVYTERER
jgi:hypothetical protein